MPERPVAVARELTKFYEEVVRGSAEEVAGRFPEPPKGEVVLVLGPWEAPGLPAGPSDEAGAAEQLRRWSPRACPVGARPKSSRD
jgi:16S rRNA (cytidine1402-2'-O)-methyltransferase